MKCQNNDLKQRYNYLLKLSLLIALCLHLAGFSIKKEFGLHPAILKPIKPRETDIIQTDVMELPEEPPEIPPPPSVVVEGQDDDPDAVETILEQHRLWELPLTPKLPAPDYTNIYDEAPVAVRQIRPEYPKLARIAQLEGIVYVTAYIDTLGNVVKTEIAQSAHEMLDRAAANAIAQWHFTPARMMDKPVAVIVEVPVVFNLKD